MNTKVNHNDTKSEVSTSTRRVSDVTIQVFIMLILLTVMVIATRLVNENFFKPFNLRGMVREISILAIFALGQGIVIIAGGIDLSVGSLICLVGTLVIVLINNVAGITFPVAVLIVITLAAVLGLFHGLLICYLKLQPFLVTLCSLLVFRSITRALTKDSTVAFDDRLFPFFAQVGAGTWWGIPIPFYILVGILIPILFFMHYTISGRYLYAIGYNLEAARFSGVRINALRILTFVLCAVLAAVAGILEASSIGSRTPSNAGMAYELYAITAAVLGGCTFRGGQGSILGIVVGAAVLRVILPLVIFFGVSTVLTDAVTGIILLSAVIVDALIKQSRMKKQTSLLTAD
jgi:ribose transport system permease protein